VPVATFFGSVDSRIEHFENHGDDFGLTDDADYQAEARNFLNADRTIFVDIQECERSNGDVIRFNAVTNQYAVMTMGGGIKTYYKPMPRHLAPPSYPRWKITHPYPTNQRYFDEDCKQ
jgi:pyocin large subunit-like protein